MFKVSDVRISAGSLFQTLILLKFIDISDFFTLYFGSIKLLLFLYCTYGYQSVFHKILAFKFKHLNICYEI